MEHLNSAYKATEDCRARLGTERASKLTYCRTNRMQLIKAKDKMMEIARLADLPVGHGAFALGRGWIPNDKATVKALAELTAANDENLTGKTEGALELELITRRMESQEDEEAM